MPWLDVLFLVAGVALAEPPLTAELVEDATPASAARPVQTVLTFDNGEFNLPLYTPRWNGRFARPSAAQEIAANVARVSGANPVVFSYLPAGRTAGRPGAPERITPHLARCQGAAERPGDPCWCNPADRCWDELGPNYHPDASTSLYLTAVAVREQLRGAGPRVEIHFADLFEEDPSAAEDPADSDRCVTLDGTRKAVQGLVRLGDGESLDHLAVGVLRVRVEPPPPGGSWGNLYDLKPLPGGSCWSGVKRTSWEAGQEPLDMALGVIVLGVDTADLHSSVDALLDGLVGQLTSEDMALHLVRLREPPATTTLTDRLRGPALDWRIPPAAQLSRLPCGIPSVEVDLHIGSLPVIPASAVARCDGSLDLHLPPPAIHLGFAREAGMDPRVDSVELTGRVTLLGDGVAVREAFAALEPHATSAQRSLPLWAAVGQGWNLVDGANSEPPWRPWSHTVEIRRLTLSGVDRRPWVLALVGAFAGGVALGTLVYLILERVHAERALHTHWDQNVGPGRDPLRQRPLASVLAEAQEEVRRRWGQRVTLGITFGLLVAAATFWLLMRLHLVSLG